MCSIPDRRLGSLLKHLAIASTVAVVGCQRMYVSTPEPLAEEMTTVDEAMQLRQWAQTAATYPDGATVAGPTNFKYEARSKMSEWRYYYADPLVFTGNALAAPYWALREPPTREVIYQGMVIDPSHHAMPPLPPEFAVPPAESVPQDAMPSDPVAPSDPGAPVDPVAPVDPTVPVAPDAPPAEPAPLTDPAPATQPG
jgi:hypothetical protein